ncbi:hypothetical protein PAAG_11340 [Paracoccidioides lutzii Pb01]|uniref:Uncharacterized protein n=1 Tax=Paracoccidioides lutzii (strain ATCC MYA-826 / Pb01) TaxID=502779 RepID=A0A0A2VM51_PARBA|nr:hypothetical protein PAAG_11340 [Paracoccidioides lutzii Pb01]KGQ01949.1 hypothetical protein PAAG_11340 [Paracoccidioides lutzii Pb01]
MKLSMADSVEILVHISAPGTTKEDTNYRAHSDAYLEFEPLTRVKIYPDDPGSEISTEEIGDPPSDASQKQPQPDQLDGKSQKESSHHIPNFTLGKCASFSSTWGPSFGETTCGLLDLSQSSAPRSFSQNDTNVVSDNSFLSPRNRSRVSETGPATPCNAISSSQATETPPSEVPESQSSFQASWSVEKDNTPPGRPKQVIQIERSPSGGLHSQSKRRRVSVLPACIPSSIHLGTTPTSSTSELLRASQFHSQYDKPGLPRQETFERVLLPLEINPPRPVPSSTAQFTTHVTPTLQMLADKLKLSKVFKPSLQTRSLRTLERGYWLLNLTISDSSNNANDNNSTKSYQNLFCMDDALSNKPRIGPPWSRKCFFDFWDFLSKFIAHDGRAGWGVWCICESRSSTSSSIDPTDSHSIIDLTSQDSAQIPAENKTPQPDDNFNLIKHIAVKIFTWGETAPHIYLLMYLASDRKVRKVPGVQWRDGADKLVIFMG